MSKAMAKTSMVALAGAVLALTLASPAQAITLTNRDAADQTLQITEGGDEAVTHDVVIAADEVLEGLCEEGCTIALENGEQQSFEGYEDVTIEDGQFLIAE